MSITNGFIDWAVRIDGIADKVYSAKNTGEWITCHSIVGSESETQDGIPNRFLSTEQVSPGRYSAAAAASCMFILRKNGTLIQMYPITASTWTSGGPEANTRSWAIESEGGPPSNTREPLTQPQVTTFVRLVREWEARSGKKAVPGVTLLQHKDVAQQFGYDATACASDRYDNAWAAVVAGADVKPQEEDVTELEDLMLALFSGSEERTLTREERLKNARYRVKEVVDLKAQSVAQVAYGHMHEAGAVKR